MPSELKYWLSFNNGAEIIQLPVNPETISVSAQHAFEDFDVLQLGERTVIGERKLREISFASFFPRDYHPSYCEYQPVPDPWSLVRQIEKWQASGRPMRFQVAVADTEQLGGPKLNVAATIRSFQYREVSGHPGDVFYDLTLKEYVFPTIREEVLPEQRSRAPEEQESARVYVVKAQDSLWLIAKRMLGNGDRWRELYDANRQVIGPNPNLIHPGQVLEVPAG
ncbi:LysM peptidoglycan-binding domain-containing protein [Xylanibacillus composti]|uniref:Phage-like element PBSX protein XkdP n=1 Tax=Xylanibacillus composti TaxID=1572762 RepID=A0A8J4M3I2_9BACL|nr:LysM peptidoglycan-binding domain-containing protein [Xylanibacillus composti]MDT9725090.1 LysM peptidoglycan-binding domain-containing protein [Xylanibacillus composti]GIQ70905.1 phage-like element PBSX protein XkdP [Xylanibacillus composti]